DIRAERSRCRVRVDACGEHRARGRARTPRLRAHICRRPHEPRPADRLRVVGVLGWPGGIAPALAARPDRLRGARGLAEPEAGAPPRGRGCTGARWRAPLLLFPAGPCGAPVRALPAARRRWGANPDLADPLHGPPPAAALPRLRGLDGSVRL